MYDALYDAAFQFHFPHTNATQDERDNLRSFCLRVAYRGDAFCGWQTQPNNEEQPSVQKTLENYLDPLFVYRNVNSAPHKSANLPVAGRTDSGVHAIGQICRFRTHRQDLTAEDIQQHVSDFILQGPSRHYLKVTNVVEVTRAFHPTFTTSCRAYVYMIDIQDAGFWSFEQGVDKKVSYLNSILLALEGKDLDYFGLSYGRPKTQDFNCTLYHCRASLVKPFRQFGQKGGEDTINQMAVCIELVGSRFLRRMVRRLVQASMGLVAEKWQQDQRTVEEGEESPFSCGDQALLGLVLKKDRALISRTAPAHGLLFVAAGLMVDS
jgi:tRNA pseudouridine(38-40) synthase